jgi:hypothetical protein
MPVRPGKRFGLDLGFVALAGITFSLSSYTLTFISRVLFDLRAKFEFVCVKRTIWVAFDAHAFLVENHVLGRG